MGGVSRAHRPNHREGDGLVPGERGPLTCPGAQTLWQQRISVGTGLAGLVRQPSSLDNLALSPPVGGASYTPVSGAVSEPLRRGTCRPHTWPCLASFRRAAGALRGLPCWGRGRRLQEQAVRASDCFRGFCGESEGPPLLGRRTHPGDPVSVGSAGASEGDSIHQRERPLG